MPPRVTGKAPWRRCPSIASSWEEYLWHSGSSWVPGIRKLPKTEVVLTSRGSQSVRVAHE